MTSDNCYYYNRVVTVKRGLKPMIDKQKIKSEIKEVIDNITNHTKQNLPTIRKFVADICEYGKGLDESELRDLVMIYRVAMYHLAELTCFNKGRVSEILNDPYTNEKCINTMVKDWIKKNRANSHELFKQSLGDDFGDLAYKFFSPNKEQHDSIKQETQKKNEIDEIVISPDTCDKYVETTKQLLESDSWSEIATGILASTGRRLSELFTANNFELIEGKEYSLLFKGQLKKKDNDVESYEIGVLFNAIQLKKQYDVMFNDSHVQKLLSEIDPNSDKKITEQIDDKFNFHINKVVKQYYKFIPINIQNTPDHSAKLLRKIAPCLIFARDCDRDSNRQWLSFYNAFLGHKKEDKGSTTQNYTEYRLDRDVDVEYYNFNPINSLKSEIIRLRKEVARLSDINTQKEHTIIELNEKLDREIAIKDEKIEKLEGKLQEKRATIKEDKAKKDNSDNSDNSNNYLETLSFQELKGLQTPNTVDLKLTKVLESVIKYNDFIAPSNKDRFKITSQLLIKLSGSSPNLVLKWLEQYQTMIDDHNNKYGFGYHQNRGKDINVIEIK